MYAFGFGFGGQLGTGEAAGVLGGKREDSQCMPTLVAGLFGSTPLFATAGKSHSIALCRDRVKAGEKSREEYAALERAYGREVAKLEQKEGRRQALAQKRMLGKTLHKYEKKMKKIAVRPKSAAPVGRRARAGRGKAGRRTFRDRAGEKQKHKENEKENEKERGAAEMVKVLPRPRTANPRPRAAREEEEAKGGDLGDGGEDREVVATLGPWGSGVGGNKGGQGEEEGEEAAAAAATVDTAAAAKAAAAAAEGAEGAAAIARVGTGTVQKTKKKKKRKKRKAKSKRPLSSPVRLKRSWFASVSTGSGGSVDKRLDPKPPGPRRWADSPLLSSPATARERWIRPLSFLTETGVDLGKAVQGGVSMKEVMWALEKAPKGQPPVSVPTPGMRAEGSSSAFSSSSAASSAAASAAAAAMAAFSPRLLQRPEW